MDRMNISYPPIHITNLPPTFEQLGHELSKALIYLLLPTELLYFSLYCKLKGLDRVYGWLSMLSILAFWIYPIITPISCGPARSLQHFAIAIGTMKILDIWARRKSLPIYTAGRRPADWLLSFIIMTELREPVQLGIHIVVFVLLQSLPQVFPTVLAFEVLLSIYIIWTSIQLLLRYKSSPALFGPLYLADSLTGFWSETWHNAFASPCTSLVYGPLRSNLPRYGVPIPLARSIGVLGAFALMALFHIYALAPVMDAPGLKRVGIFFFLNGIGTVAEAMVWGHRRHWLKTVLAWVFEVALASWTAEAARIPNGLSHVPWREMCDAR